jgi:hypothetical protein
LSEDEEEEERDEKEPQNPLMSNPDLQNHYIKPRASIISLQSVATVSTVSSYATLTPEPMAFQARRKRAAKLAHFFGATYRDLFGEVLDRIERGMLEEMRRGDMSREEMRVSNCFTCYVAICTRTDALFFLSAIIGSTERAQESSIPAYMISLFLFIDL